MLLFLALTACGPTDDTDGTGEPLDPPDYCPAIDRAVPLQDVTTTPASSWLVHHPAEDGVVPTVIFLPGGPGDRGSAEFAFSNWLTQGNGGFRIVLPYATDGDLNDEGPRIDAVREEVLACWGAAGLHLAGTSNGGRNAYARMLATGYDTLLGAPGLFEQSVTDEALTSALAGKRVFNGVGEIDGEWRPAVEETDARLVGLGIDSQLVLFAGQGHVLDGGFDESVFFAFWRGE